MKETLFKCKLTAEAVDTYLQHIEVNPNGMSLYSGKSRSKIYEGYKVYETKKLVVVEELKT